MYKQLLKDLETISSEDNSWSEVEEIGDRAIEAIQWFIKELDQTNRRLQDELWRDG